MYRCQHRKYRGPYWVRSHRERRPRGRSEGTGKNQYIFSYRKLLRKEKRKEVLARQTTVLHEESAGAETARRRFPAEAAGETVARSTWLRAHTGVYSPRCRPGKTGIPVKIYVRNDINRIRPRSARNGRAWRAEGNGRAKPVRCGCCIGQEAPMVLAENIARPVPVLKRSSRRLCRTANNSDYIIP